MITGMKKVLNIANELEVTESIKRRCSIQIHYENYVADGPKEYYKRAVAIPFLDHLTQGINARFSTNNLVTYCGFSIMPSVLSSDEGRVMVVNEPQWKVNFKKFISKYKVNFQGNSTKHKTSKRLNFFMNVTFSHFILFKN